MHCNVSAKYRIIKSSVTYSYSFACSLQGLWRGTLPAQLLTIPYTATQFVALQQVKSLAYQNGLMTKELAPIMSFVSGALAGATATVASYPFDLLRTTLAAQGEPKVLANTACSLFRISLGNFLALDC